jgi:hypothetical protein
LNFLIMLVLDHVARGLSRVATIGAAFPLGVEHESQTTSTFSMTSVARSRIDGGTARPSALAVLRFTGHLELGWKLYWQIARLRTA